MSHNVHFTARPIKPWKRKHLSNLYVFDVVIKKLNFISLNGFKCLLEYLESKPEFNVCLPIPQFNSSYSTQNLSLTFVFYSTV